MKKLLFGLCFALLAFTSQAQHGLNGIIVERYYVADANDAAHSNSTNPLIEGSVTWRIYVDMQPGWKFLNAYGTTNSPLSLTTTTMFFNSDLGSFTPANISSNNAKKNTNMIDSWISGGGACAGYLGILKAEDDGLNNFVNNNTPKLLQNNDPTATPALTVKDGMIAGTVPAFAPVGITTETDVFGDGSTGNSFMLTNGAWGVQGGAAGPTASNKLLIAQITTDGTFDYKLNIQIGKDLGGGQSASQQYVWSNQNLGPNDIYDPSLHLSGNLTPGNAKPIVNITAPLNGAHILTGDVVAVAADASDPDGSVAQVEFRVDGAFLATVTHSPYTANYTSVTGTHILKAIATDNLGKTSDTSKVTINVGPHIAPNISITAPAANTQVILNDAVTINATATGNDGSAIRRVQFFVDGSTSIGIDSIAPYSVSYTANVSGSHMLTARATDDRGLSATSAVVPINVIVHVPPTVSIISPANNSSADSNAVVIIAANASASDGATVTSVQFKADGVNIGVPVTGPSYTINWTPVVVKTVALTAVVLDSKGSTTTSASVNVTVNNPNSQPYEISTVTETCLPSSFCIPVVSTKATMQNVIGYDVVLNYDKTRVTPTGYITVSNDLINASLTTYVTNIDTAHSLMNIAVFFNGSAPQGTNFHGKGQLFCATFNKTSHFASYDQAQFTATLDESYAGTVVAKPVKAGKYITYKDSTFTGYLKYQNTAQAIGYNSARPNDYLITNIYGCNKSTDAVQPDTLGKFVYDIWNGTSVKIQRDILGTTEVHDVITANDAYRASLVSVKLQGFTPSIFEIIAMDVNMDGMISAGDASQINQRAVLRIPEFKQAWNATNGKPSHDWLFVNDETLAGNAYKISATYPANDGIGYSKYKVPVVDTCQSVPMQNYPNCPLIGSDVYHGILLGDNDESYFAIPHDGLLKNAEVSDYNAPSTKTLKDAEGDMIIVDLTKAEELANGDISVPVSLSASSVVNSFDFDVVIDDQKLAVKSVNNPNNLNLAWNYLTDKKKLLVASYSLNAIPSKNAISMSLIISGTEKVDASDFNATLALVNGKQATLKVVSSPNGIDEATLANLVKVYPNPANDVLYIDVPASAKIQIFDISGKRVVYETEANAYEINTVDVKDFTAGVYFVKVTSESFVKMQKVIISR